MTTVVYTPSRQSVDQANAVNVGLMLASAAVAWIAPFELFLASYAVLGPLHYLTEISWLHDRGYFTTRRYDVLPLVLLGLVDFGAHYTGLIAWDGAVVLALGIAAALLLADAPLVRAALVGAAIVATLAAERWTAGWLALAVLLPTVVHVFCFTGLFILQGSVKTGSRWGYASFGVFLVCGTALLFYQPPAGQYAVSPRTAALAEEFGGVIDQLIALSGASPGWDGLAAVGRFLAFAYTYHYLNWFSKTGVIGWHAIGSRRLAAIVALWLGSIAVYAYDYRVGLLALFVLSLVHVLLEFPLDLRTMAALAGPRAKQVPA